MYIVLVCTVLPTLIRLYLQAQIRLSNIKYTKLYSATTPLRSLPPPHPSPPPMNKNLVGIWQSVWVCDGVYTETAMSVSSRRSSYVLSLDARTHTPYLSCIPRERESDADIPVTRSQRVRIFKLLRSPRIDSKEQTPPGCVTWRASIRQPYSYSVPSPHRLFKNSDTWE